MAVKRLISQTEQAVLNNRKKLKVRFKTMIQNANTVAELKKCVRVLARHVFGEEDGE